MATTATKNAGRIVTRAFRKIGVVSPGVPLDASDMVEGLDVLNDMLKAWQLTGLRLYTRATGTITLLDATAAYAMPSRTLRIETIRYKPATGNEIPMLRLSGQEYDELPNKASAGTPTQFFHDRRREVSTIYTWPVIAIASGATLEWTGLGEVADITASSDSVDAPAEWYEAIIHGLAARLAYDYQIELQERALLAQQARSLYDTAMAGDLAESVTFGPDW